MHTMKKRFLKRKLQVHKELTISITVSQLIMRFTLFVTVNMKKLSVTERARGSTAVKALRYKPEGDGFETR
jgi:hypothetical protein